MTTRLAGAAGTGAERCGGAVSLHSFAKSAVRHGEVLAGLAQGNLLERPELIYYVEGLRLGRAVGWVEQRGSLE